MMFNKKNLIKLFLIIILLYSSSFYLISNYEDSDLYFGFIYRVEQENFELYQKNQIIELLMDNNIPVFLLFEVLDDKNKEIIESIRETYSYDINYIIEYNLDKSVEFNDLFYIEPIQYIDRKYNKKEDINLIIDNQTNANNLKIWIEKLNNNNKFKPLNLDNIEDKFLLNEYIIEAQEEKMSLINISINIFIGLLLLILISLIIILNFSKKKRDKNLF